MKTLPPFPPTRGQVPVWTGAPRYLSIDPGGTTGWALFESLRTSFESRMLSESLRLVACGTGYPPFDGVQKMAIELPQSYPDSPVPYQDLLSLAVTAGRVVGFYELEAVVESRGSRSLGNGIEVETYLPKQWKGQLPKDVCAKRIRAVLTPSELEVIAACEKIICARGGGGKSVLHNVIDAVGIGLHAFTHRWR